MIVHHHPSQGKCLFCGLRSDNLRDPDNADGFKVDGDGKVLYDDTIYCECPAARALLFKVYCVLVLPFSLLAGGVAPFVFCLILAAVVFGGVLRADEVKWVGMNEVRDEYESLIAVVPRGADNFYVKQIDEAVRPLFALRDRALNCVKCIAATPLDDLGGQIDAIRARAQTLDDDVLEDLYRSQLRDLHANQARIEEMHRFVEKFEASKKCVVASIQLLRNRVVAAVDPADEQVRSRFLDDLKTLHAAYARVNEGDSGHVGRSAVTSAAPGQTSVISRQDAPGAANGVGESVPEPPAHDGRSGRLPPWMAARNAVSGSANDPPQNREPEG